MYKTLRTKAPKLPRAAARIAASKRRRKQGEAAAAAESAEAAAEPAEAAAAAEEEEEAETPEEVVADSKRPCRPSQARAKKQTAPAAVGTPERRGSSQAEAAAAKRPRGLSFFSKYVVKKDANGKDDDLESIHSDPSEHP